jgi:hypothetical protein
MTIGNDAQFPQNYRGLLVVAAILTIHWLLLMAIVITFAQEGKVVVLNDAWATVLDVLKLDVIRWMLTLNGSMPN